MIHPRQVEKKVGFIGAGNMAQSIIGGMLENGWSSNQILASAPSQKTQRDVHNKFAITVSDNNEKTAHADIVFLCAKPQQIQGILLEIAPVITKQQPLVISVAAGITMENIMRWASGLKAIIRSMPNTPSLVGKGACGIFANSQVTDEQKLLAESIFQSVGIVEWVKREELIDAVIAVSGSGSAYYFLFMEAMIDAGVRLGFTPEVAKRLTIQTALGAAEMALRQDESMAQLRQNVCSPGGTTEQAVIAFQDGGLASLVGKAMGRAVKRAKEMAEELSK